MLVNFVYPNSEQLAIIGVLVLFASIFLVFSIICRRHINWSLEVIGERWSHFLGAAAHWFSCLCILMVFGSVLTFFGEWLTKDDQSKIDNSLLSLGGPKDEISLAGRKYFATTICQPVLIAIGPGSVYEFAHCAVIAIFWSPYFVPVSCLILIWLAMRCHLFWRFSQNAMTLHFLKQTDSNEDPRTKLLPTQKKVYNEIVSRIRLKKADSEPLAIAIEGEWGAGKSWLLRSIEQRFAPRVHHAIKAMQAAESQGQWRKSLRFLIQPGWNPEYLINEQTPSTSENNDTTKYIYLSINAWQYATEEDLHWGLLETLLSHPLVPTPQRFFGFKTTNFFRYPLITLPVYAMRSISQAFERGRVSLPGGMTVSVALSGMLWQRYIDYLTEMLVEEDCQVVWCLDEIDRSSPEMAQATITLIRRFLNQPGTVVIVPYVAQQLRFKVFNPLMAVRPDLQSNMLAVLNHELEHDIQENFRGPNFSQHLGLHEEAPLLPQPPERAIDGTIPDLNSGSGPLISRLHWKLMGVHLSGNLSSRDRRTFWYEEKYLRQAHLRLGRLTGEDVESLFVESAKHVPQIKGAVKEFVNIFVPDLESRGKDFHDEVFDQVRRKVKTAIDRSLMTRAIGAGNRPVLRHFLDELRGKLVVVTRFYSSLHQQSKKDPIDALRQMLPGFEGVVEAFRSAEDVDAIDENADKQNARYVAGLLIFITLLAYVRSGRRLLREEAR